VEGFRLLPDELVGGLVEVAPEIWTLEAREPVYFRPPMQPSYPYTHRAIVIRLNHRDLFVVSPIRLTPEIRASVDQLGTVKYLVSPNQLHHLHLGEWSSAYPEARLYASPKLPQKRKDLQFEAVLTGTPELAWADQIDQCLFGSQQGLLDEIVFLHRASRTVIFTDLIMDFDPASFSPLSRMTTQWNQMYRHTPRGVQLAHLFDRDACRAALNTVRNWQSEFAIVAHSPWVCVTGEAVTALLNQAFDWLTPRPRLVEAMTVGSQFLLLLLVVLPVHAVVVLFAEIIYPRLSQQTVGQ
jgi:Domain of unknown function (DUF4336)